MLALEWLKNAHGIMEKLEATQLEIASGFSLTQGSMQ